MADRFDREPPTLLRPVCYLAAAWAGAAVMGFELAATRLLMPSFGTGVQVWSAVIAATLGFLAIGYAAGGWVADARPGPATLATLLLVAGWALLGVRVVGPEIPNRLNTSPLSFVTAASFSAALILAVPLLMLGAVQPTLARLMIDDRIRAGRTVGGLLAAGSAGSVAGTVLTGLLLIPRLGTAATLFILGAVTSLSAVLVLFTARRWWAALIFSIIAAPVLLLNSRTTCGPEPAGPMNVLERVEGVYGQLEILDYKGLRTLACNGVFQTAIPMFGLGMGPGTLIRGRDYTELIPFLRPGADSVLLIGLGGGLHARALAFHGLTVDAVEIDPAAVQLAQDYFDYSGQVTVADGRAFLARATNTYDALVLDTFVGGAVPEHLYTAEAFSDVAAHLGSKGVFVVHMIGRPQHPAIQAVFRTMQAVFPHVRAARSGMADELQHFYLYAARRPLKLGSGELRRLEELGFTGREWVDIDTSGAAVLTDDRTDLALLGRDLVARHHRLCLLQRRNPPW